MRTRLPCETDAPPQRIVGDPRAGGTSVIPPSQLGPAAQGNTRRHSALYCLPRRALASRADLRGHGDHLDQCAAHWAGCRRHSAQAKVSRIKSGVGTTLPAAPHVPSCLTPLRYLARPSIPPTTRLLSRGDGRIWHCPHRAATSGASPVPLKCRATRRPPFRLGGQPGSYVASGTCGRHPRPPHAPEKTNLLA